MNIEELKKEKEVMEGRLRDLIGSELRRFKEETGVEVQAISIDIDKANRIGIPEPLYCLTGVSCRIEI